MGGAGCAAAGLGALYQAYQIDVEARLREDIALYARRIMYATVVSTVTTCALGFCVGRYIA